MAKFSQASQAKAIQIIWDMAKDKSETDDEILEYVFAGCSSLEYSRAKMELAAARAYHHPEQAVEPE